MQLRIEKQDNQFIVDNLDAAGMAKIGRGKTIRKALGDFLISHQKELGITSISMDKDSMLAEEKRRKKQLNKR
jgi:hypothetical protein